MPKTRAKRARKGLRSVLVRLKPTQDDALARIALRRAVERCTAKADKSELVREAIDLYLKARDIAPQAALHVPWDRRVDEFFEVTTGVRNARSFSVVPVVAGS